MICRTCIATVFIISCLVTTATAGEQTAALDRRLIVIGVDGMDPKLLQQFMNQEILPNLSRLASMGGFMSLGTSIPPQSPVAWSDFITGMDPGGHGLFDFLALDRKTLVPYLSTTRVEKPNRGPVTVGPWRLPLGADRPVLLRDGEAFWQQLDAHGIETTIFRIPANYPPVHVGSGRALSGMGTPDLRGTSGTFAYYTDDIELEAGEVPGGVIERVIVNNGTFRAHLLGPPNAYREESPPASIGFAVYVDAQNPVAVVRISGQQVVLNVGEWSDWVQVDFTLVPGLVSIPGMVRFFLKQTQPNFGLYVSPVNIDPRRPAQSIAAPPEYATELAEAVGPFYSQEMPEDTKALSAKVLNSQQFLEQSGLVLDERRRLLKHELQRFRENDGGGFLFFYLSSVDQRHHMLYRHMDPVHPLHNRKAPEELTQAMRKTYQEVDELIGWILDDLDEATTLIVMSDHGFAPFRRQAHLNAWLEQNGYLRLEDSDHRYESRWLQGIDWSHTRAFAIGLNSLYVNVRGREKHGIVDPAEREALAREIREKLLAWKDAQTGEHVVTQAPLREQIYRGPHLTEAPDLIVGYARGYRASWDTTTGMVPAELLEDNKHEWSGDHCMDSRVVPGVVLSSRPITVERADLRDLTVTILTYFGLPVPTYMRGRSILGPFGGDAHVRQENIQN